MPILQMSLSIPIPPQTLSFSRVLSSQSPLFLQAKFSQLSIQTPKIPTQTTTIRMGGGPRTYPGGVSKWQWKRMQAKKAKQLLKVRLTRERRIYEMRKRAELKSAISELERPWEAVEKAPTLFSVSADEQLKVLADRFQKPGGFDMWSDRDGPQLFETPHGISKARFFPKGVVHSVKPHSRRIDGGAQVSLPGDASMAENNGSEIRKSFNAKFGRSNRVKFAKSASNGLKSFDRGQNGYGYENAGERVSERNGSEIGKSYDYKFGKQRNRRKFETEASRSSGLKEFDSGRIGSDSKRSSETPSRHGGGGSWFRKGDASQKLRGSDAEVYDMSLQQDGSYKF